MDTFSILPVAWLLVILWYFILWRKGLLPMECRRTTWHVMTISSLWLFYHSYVRISASRDVTRNHLHHAFVSSQTWTNTLKFQGLELIPCHVNLVNRLMHERPVRVGSWKLEWRGEFVSPAWAPTCSEIHHDRATNWEGSNFPPSLCPLKSRQDIANRGLCKLPSIVGCYSDLVMLT